MTKIQAIETIKNHPRYIDLKNEIINKRAGAVFKPRYDSNNKWSTFIMKMLLQELKDAGLIDTYLYFTYIRTDKIYK